MLTIGWEQFASAVDLSGVSLVKVDIEGAEFDLLPTLLPWLERHRPALFLSTHAPYLDPDTRADRMRRLAESLSFYSTWQDKRLRPTGPGALTQDPALTGFETYLLTP
ncbi:hypothetical protein ACFOHS_08085 [Jhaorihella thermophila]